MFLSDDVIMTSKCDAMTTNVQRIVRLNIASIFENFIGIQLVAWEILAAGSISIQDWPKKACLQSGTKPLTHFSKGTFSQKLFNFSAEKKNYPEIAAPIQC